MQNKRWIYIANLDEVLICSHDVRVLCVSLIFVAPFDLGLVDIQLFVRCNVPKSWSIVPERQLRSLVVCPIVVEAKERRWNV